MDEQMTTLEILGMVEAQQQQWCREMARLLLEEHIAEMEEMIEQDDAKKL